MTPMPATFRQRVQKSAMPRVVSFIVLLAILLLVGAIFFQVMAHFVVPLFLASVLVVVFKPLHARVVKQIPYHPRISALVTTLLIMLAVLLPAVWLGWKAAIELRTVYAYIRAEAPAEPGQPDVIVAPAADASAGGDATVVVATSAEPPVNPQLLEQLVNRTPKPLRDLYESATGAELQDETIRGWLKGALGAVASFAVSGLQMVVKLLFGLIIMILALYYFLADGPRMLASLMKLSPLDDEYERELLDKFANVSRAVVVASLASAAAQGLLAGIGYYFALNAGAPIFLLTMLTMCLAIVPFAGAAAIWVPTAAWIYLYQPVIENGKAVLDAAGQPLEGDAVPAIALAIYGACIVSAIDNVIKPLVLHGQSNLHPLVALISILGGVQTLGPIGILVGPMLVAFFQALVNMVNKELYRLGDGTLEGQLATAAVPLPPPGGLGPPESQPTHAESPKAKGKRRR
jgi:predicted PurR-regulated permease PerM